MFSEGLAPVMDAGKWGYIDKTGKVVIPCKWGATLGFSEGLAPVMDDHEKWGFIDKEGKVAIPCKWEYANGFSEGQASVMDADGMHTIDKTGQAVN